MVEVATSGFTEKIFHVNLSRVWRNRLCDFSFSFFLTKGEEWFRDVKMIKGLTRKLRESNIWGIRILRFRSGQATWCRLSLPDRLTDPLLLRCFHRAAARNSPRPPAFHRWHTKTLISFSPLYTGTIVLLLPDQGPVGTISKRTGTASIVEKPASVMVGRAPSPTKDASLLSSSAPHSWGSPTDKFNLLPRHPAPRAGPLYIAASLGLLVRLSTQLVCVCLRQRDGSLTWKPYPRLRWLCRVAR